MYAYLAVSDLTASSLISSNTHEAATTPGLGLDLSMPRQLMNKYTYDKRVAHMTSGNHSTLLLPRLMQTIWGAMRHSSDHWCMQATAMLGLVLAIVAGASGAVAGVLARQKICSSLVCFAWFCDPEVNMHTVI